MFIFYDGDIYSSNMKKQEEEWSMYILKCIDLFENI